MKYNQTHMIIAAACLTLISITSVAIAHKGATGVVKVRMDAMKDISTQMKLMKKMIRGKQPYDAVRFKNAAETIEKHGLNIPKQFPKGSAHKPSRAKIGIWQDWEKFSDLTRNLTVNAKTLAEMAEATSTPKSLRRTFGKLAKTCKACHKTFRQKKR
jgi:cytochrome c556